MSLLYGLRVVRVAALEEDGGVPAAPVWKTIDAAQQFNASPVIIAGQQVEQRGGDALQCVITEPDKVIGVDITLQDAKMDLSTLPVLVGGTYTPAAEGPPAVNASWEPDDIDAEAPGFVMEMYQARYDPGTKHQSDAAGYVKYTFPNCRATGPQDSQQDRQFTSPQYTIKARWNSADDLAYRKIEEVAALPA